MSDFDFDELDKAVAGATSSDVNQVVTDVEEPTEQRVVEIPSTSNTDGTPKAAPAARRSSGRFMDVVHPSSDMRGRTPSTPPATSSVKSEATSFVPPVAPSEETPSDDVSTIDDSDAAVGEWSKPLETPFLPGAKVEKRPLGGVGPEPTQELLDAPEEELKLEVSDELLLEAHALPDPIDFAAHTAALESEKEDTSTQTPEEESEEQSIEQLDELKMPEEPEAVHAAASEAAPHDEPVGPTSIQQQYTEQPTSSQESGAIFDTENYHQPLAAAPKKRSGVWTVIWILLLVILGAAAGVAFYLYVLPTL